MLGSVTVHKRLNTECYDYLAASLTRAKPALRNVLAVGSDGDSNIFKGMKQQFPTSTWVLCKKHVEDNLRRYLTSIGITGNDQQLFIGDIFGDIQQRKSGLSDSVAGMQFGRWLKAAKDRWDQKERSIRNVKEAQFYSWFVRYKADKIKEKLLYPVRRDVGLGYDFNYNNANESINNSVKWKKAYKRCKEIVEFTEKVREIKDIQQRNVEGAVIGEGPNHLRNNYAKELEVDPDVWFHQMTPLRRQQHLDKLMSTEVKLPESQLQDDAGAGPKPKAALNQLMPFASYQCDSKSLAYQDLCMQDYGKKQMNWLPKKMQCTRSLGHKTTKRFSWKVQVEGHQNQTTLLSNQTVVSYAIVISLKKLVYVAIQSLFQKELEHLNHIFCGSRKLNFNQIFPHWLYGKVHQFKGKSLGPKGQETAAEILHPEMMFSVPVTIQEPPMRKFGRMIIPSSWCSSHQIKKMHHLQNTFNKGGNAPYNLCLSHKERFYYPFQGDFQDIRESASEKTFTTILT